MKRETRNFYEGAVRRAVERIVQGIDEALDLEDLANEAALSPFHFHRVFRGMVGETPLELHRRLGMERAAWALRNKEARVTAIAFDAGYETHESFTRAFRDRFGCSPSEFRRRRRVEDGPDCERAPQIELAARSGIHFVPDCPLPFNFDLFIGDQLMNAEIVDRPELRVATVHHKGPYNRISEAFGRLGNIAGKAGIIGPSATMIAIYHDDPETTAEEDLRSEAGIVVPENASLPSELMEMRIPSGRYASATHIGPYEELGDAWARLMGGWLPSSGQRVGDGVSYEIYRNTPADTPKEKLRTELFLPLK